MKEIRKQRFVKVEVNLTCWVPGATFVATVRCCFFRGARERPGIRSFSDLTPPLRLLRPPSNTLKHTLTTENTLIWRKKPTDVLILFSNFFAQKKILEKILRKKTFKTEISTNFEWIFNWDFQSRHMLGSMTQVRGK